MKKKESSFYDNIAKRYCGNKPTIYSFFYHLYTLPKPDVKKTTENELIWWFIKIKIGQLFLNLYQKKFDFYTWLTQYYPFSLLFRGRIFHAKMKNLRKFIEKLENLVNRSGLRIIIIGNRIENNMTIFSAISEKEPSKSKLKIIEKHLQKKFKSVFVRKNNDRINIIFPNEVFKKYY